MSNYVMPEVAKIQLYRLLADYCHRYQQILMQLPIAVHQGLHIDQNSSVAGARSCINAYIDLCAEQVYLHAHGMVPEEVWSEWTQGIRAMFRLLAVRDVWEDVSGEARYKDLLGLLDKPE